VQKIKTNLVLIILILLFSILVSLPLLKPGLHLIHDDQHIARLYLFDQALKAGQFPVRWVNGLGFNFGYPLFVFYPPLAYIVGEIYHLIGFGFTDSVKLVFFSSILFSGIAMYILVRELWGKFPALISALFYLLVPYRALDVYVRGALAESFSFVWLPLIFWSYNKLFYTRKVIYVYLSGIFLALLMITHNLIFLPFTLILPIYLIYLTIQSEHRETFVVYSLLSIVYGFFLSAYFWIPALLEKKYTIVDEMLLTNLANYKIHFVYPQQLWNWTWGFGGSAEGLMDGISFKIGKLHILVSITAFILALIHLAKAGSRKLPVTSYQLPVTLFLLFIFSAFMTTFYSKFIWEIVKPLGYLQFPWRFLTFTALFSSILAGAFIYLLRLTILRLVLGSILIILLLTPNLKLFQPQNFRPNLTNEIATSNEVINWDVSQTSFEYIPKGVELIKDERNVNILNITKNDIPKERVVILGGEAQINTVKDKPHKVEIQVDSAAGVNLQANLFNFPGWQVKIDDEQVKVEDDNRLKLINFKVPSGIHNIEIVFGNTNVRLLANLLSVFSMFTVVAFVLIKKWRILTKN